MEKQNHPLKEFYKDIYGRYDLVNRVFTFGRDRHWRTKAVKECILNAPARVLDVCTGTGDLALEIASMAEGISVTGYDFSAEMLMLAREKAGNNGFESNATDSENSKIHDNDRDQARQDSTRSEVTFIEGDVAQMPFETGTFDTAGISFGIRNLVYENSNADKHLAEIHRVLRDYGRFVILESSKPNSPVWRIFNGIYLRFILPYLGGLISGNLKAYRYLAQSSKNYYSKEEMGSILQKAGFGVLRAQSLFLGSVMLVVAEKQPKSSEDQANTEE